MSERNWVPLVLLSGLFLVSACMSARNHPALDAAQNAVNGKGGETLPSGVRSAEVFSEAYIEYPGPHARWVGPASFVLHVSAKDPHWALIHVAPNWFNTMNEEPVKPGEESTKINTKGLSSDYARERIRYLAGALQQGGETSFKGCLYPVRVRLIREDGTFLEKTGCRGETGWPKAASEATEYFLTAKLRGLGEPGAIALPTLAESAPMPGSSGSPAPIPVSSRPSSKDEQ